MLKYCQIVKYQTDKVNIVYSTKCHRRSTPHSGVDGLLFTMSRYGTRFA